MQLTPPQAASDRPSATAVAESATASPDAPSPRSGRLAVVLVATSTAALLATVILVGIGFDPDEELGEWVVACFGPGFLVSGWWLVRRRPRLSIGWLFLAAGFTVSIAGAGAAWTTAALAEGWPGAAWGLWVFSWMWLPHSVLLGVALLLFPDGVVRSRWHRTLIVVAAAPLAVAMAWAAVRPGVILTTPDHPDGSPTGLVNPLGIDGLAGIREAMGALVLVITLPATLIPMVWTAWWWWRSAELRRRQFRWATLVQLAWLVVTPIVLGIPGELGPALAIATTLGTQALFVVAILQWQAYDVDVVVRRSVLAASMAAVALAVYGAVVVLVALVVGSTGTVPSAIGATVAALALGPLSTRIRIVVNRLFFGRRDDPYSVVSELGRQLAVSAEADDGLTAVTVALAAALHLPYAAVIGRDGRELATSGKPSHGDRLVDRPLVHQGETVGALRIELRRGSDELVPAEVELLDNLAHQIGATVVAGELLDGLRAAQERLVLAREDERRRIQRDLHDGLGAELAAVMLKLDAARNHISSEAIDDADDLVGSARRDLARAVGDVRRLVYSLGDPTLASLGLAAAARDQVRSLTQGTALKVTFTAGDLPPLQAATEEAAYRIIGEAVTNVVRHADASRCEVTMGADATWLLGTVDDDGRGVGPDAPIGVGRRSMRERATELGGDLDIETGPAGGTRVRLRLPLGAPDASTT